MLPIQYIQRVGKIKQMFGFQYIGCFNGDIVMRKGEYFLWILTNSKEITICRYWDKYVSPVDMPKIYLKIDQIENLEIDDDIKFKFSNIWNEKLTWIE